MTTSGRDPASIQRFTPEGLLGPLNPVEQHNAPPVLYAAGDLGVLRSGPRVSIVGSREASAAGLQRVVRLARELAKHGVVIVSGLAKGIDTAAHRGALEAGGRTIAVLGTPLDRVYPKENRGLQDLLMRQHLVISQYVPGSQIRPSNFPRRNRTMALLSQATVIVEAGESSGSLSQGWEALRLGRALFIMRSVAEDTALRWTREMLGYGAQILTDTEDVLEILPPDLEVPLLDRVVG
jgi:DNA processing protein